MDISQGEESKQIIYEATEIEDKGEADDDPNDDPEEKGGRR